MSLTLRIVHEHDLTAYVEQHFALLNTQIAAALNPLLPAATPLAAVVAVEACVRHAVMLGNHPSLVISVASKACGIPVMRADVPHNVLVEGHAHGPAGSNLPENDTPGTRMANQALDAVARGETERGPGTTQAPPLPESITGLHGEKIRVLRAGNIAGNVIQFLTDYPPLADVMHALDETETMALFDRLSETIAKLITQGLQ